jgi:hypothetical protein
MASTCFAGGSFVAFEHAGSHQPASLAGRMFSWSAWKFENILPGVFTPILAKHTKSFNWSIRSQSEWIASRATLSRWQRQVEFWRQTQISDAQAKPIFYSAFVDGKLDAPRSVLQDVHRLYFEPEYPSSRSERCGACRRRSQARLRSSIRSRSSRRRPSWGNFSVNCLHDPCGPVHGCDSASAIRSPWLSTDLVQPTSQNPFPDRWRDSQPQSAGAQNSAFIASA